MYIKDIKIPFHEYDKDWYFSLVKQSIKDDISSTSKDYILGVDEGDYINYLVEKYLIHLVLIDYSSAEVRFVKEIKKDYYDQILGYKSTYSEYLFYIYLNFVGNTDIFRITPSNFRWTIGGTGVSPICFESENKLRLQFILHNKNKSEFERMKNDIISETFMNLDYANRDADLFNSTLPEFVKETFKYMKASYIDDNEFFASLNVKLEGQPNDVYQVPIVEKRKPIPHPNVENVSYPIIGNDIYKRIINLIYSTYKQFESLPNNYKGKDEEALRDSILPNLQTNFTNVSATGETFNKEGKTDICIKHTDGTNVFIGECKIWKGEKKFCEAINQLFDRYVTWNDTKVALIFFVKNNNYSDILSRAKVEIKKHAYYVRTVSEPVNKTSYSYIFRHAEDPQRFIQTEVMFFHFNQE